METKPNVKHRTTLWFPILKKHGFTNLKLVHGNVVGCDSRLGEVSFELMTRYERYGEEQLAQYKNEFTVRYSIPSDMLAEMKTFLHQDRTEYPNFYCYGWVRNNSIVDYVIFDTTVLRKLYAAGHLNGFISEKKENTKGTLSSFIPIPISSLIKFPQSQGLIAYHSGNHPALLDE